MTFSPTYLKPTYTLLLEFPVLTSNRSIISKHILPKKETSADIAYTRAAYKEQNIKHST
jgi:hypothetical protein